MELEYLQDTEEEEEKVPLSIPKEETPGEQAQRLYQRKRKANNSEEEEEPAATSAKTKRVGESGGKERVVNQEADKQKETHKETPPANYEGLTVREVIWNRKEHLVGFLRKILPVRAHTYAQMVQEASVEEWVTQFQTYVIPLYRLGLMRVVIQKIMDKVGVRMEELGNNLQEARLHYQQFTTYMTTFARLIQMLPH